MLFIFTALTLSLWFWRREKADATLWMLTCYAGIGGMIYQDYAAASTLHDSFPKILKDFILLGMVGFVQNLAIHKRISILTAVISLMGLFFLANYLEDLLPEEEAETISLLVEFPEGEATGLTVNGLTPSPAFTPKSPDATLLDNYYEVTCRADEQESVMRELRRQGAVYIEPNEDIQVMPFLTATGESTRPVDLNTDLGIDDPEVGQQWAMQVLEMKQYYRLLQDLRPKKVAKIAILDTGVDGRHEDIADNYFSVEKRYDNDPVGHGTHCAGIAAGVTNNGLGIGSLAGVGGKHFVELTSIKVLNSGGMGTQKSIIAGIIEAVDEGVDVISLSLGGYSNQSRQRAYNQAVKYATDNGVIVVAAAGNSNRAATDFAPANAKGIITVAAVDDLLLRAPFSNKNHGIAQPLAAPGVNIFSTIPNGNYRAYSGTSMACPFVAGLLGVMRSIDPGISPKEAYEVLQRSGKVGNEVALTGRIVQPAAAIRTLQTR